MACSGGLDSVVLSHLCASLELRFELAHANFQLRGKESDLDQEFVEDLGKNIHRRVHVKCFDTNAYLTQNKLNVQQAARDLRYGWFRDLLRERQLAFTVTAHQADDQLETFLINLTRGSGLRGLSGIPDTAPGLRRPLLAFPRDSIRSYATKNQIAWREDSSNLQDYYLRNRLRHRVIPALREADSRFAENFSRSLDFLKGSKALVDNHIGEVRERLFRNEGNLVRIALEELRALHPRRAYLHELFQPFGFTDWEALERLLHSASGREILSPTHGLLKDRDAFLLRPLGEDVHGPIMLDHGGAGVHEQVPLKISVVGEMGEPASNVLYLDKNALNNGLHLRRWKKGDYFYPLGMKGKQKISKYFKDHKFNRYEKEAQWLLCSGDEVVWIVGRRADDRFKVRETTTEILKIQWLDSQDFS
nr:tRNA lysidine(34) synthetase TilS [Robiginitalea marina]